MMSAEDRDGEGAEVARLRLQLEDERRLTQQWREVAEERRVTLERLRQRRIVRWLFAVGTVVLPTLRRLQSRLRRFERIGRSTASSLVGLRHRAGGPAREASLQRAVSRLPLPTADTRSVGVVILTRNGRKNLERLLPRLATAAHRPAEVVVVDNDSGPETRDWLTAQSGITVLRNDHNASFSAACNQGAAVLQTDVLLFLNDDVEPLDDHWLGRMLEHLAGDVVAVGAQLVYPRRGLMDGRVRDVSVQHFGIGAEPDGWAPPTITNLGGGEDPQPVGEPRPVLAATAACLAVDRAAFGAVGGFDGRYDYGAEDVDLGFRLRQAGGRIVVVPSAVLWHREGATRHQDDMDARARRQQANWRRLADRFGPALRHAVDEDRISGAHELGTDPFRLGITITRDLADAGYGDYHVAHALADQFRTFGWEVCFLERYRDAWYDHTADLDAVIVLHDSFDVRRIARDGLTTLAWIRNWTDRWVASPWFEVLDVIVASSRGSAETVTRDSRVTDVPVIPLATDPHRFVPGGSRRLGVVLTVNHWGEDRGVEALVAAVPQLELYGKGWEDVPAVASAWKGHLDADGLAEVYGRAAIVIDQTAGPTLKFGALNTRVFDAVAAGATVVTDQVEGAEEIFGPGVIPTWSTPEDLAATVAGLLTKEADVSMAKARATVLAEHTWEARARQFRHLIAERRANASFVIRIGAPTRREARTWGDTFFAEALAAELHAAGHTTAIQTLDEWDDIAGRGHDVVLHLKGKSRSPRVEGQRHVVWIISHPEETDPSELEVADLVLCASPSLTASLRSRLDVPVATMLQATDQQRFRPRPPDPSLAHDVLFLGNSRFAERPIVRDAVACGLPLTIIGSNWEKFVDPAFVDRTFLPNDQVPVAYSSAKVVLNDHWDGMRDAGLVSNRVFDALACGAAVVSDDNPGLGDVFGDVVATYDGQDDLRHVVDGLLADDERRRDMGRRGRELVLAEHTFAHRASQLLALLDDIERPS